jgi:SulP family sulfate permease
MAEESSRVGAAAVGEDGIKKEHDESKVRLGILWELEARFNLKLELLCGITVALAQVPEAVAFALVAGLSPAIGLNSAWIIGVVTALFGGRPAMICGATGALAVVVGDLVKQKGVEYLFYAVILMGIIQGLAGVFKIGVLVKMIPIPVMMGFCNGLAVVIGLAQFSTYKVAGDDPHRRLGGSFSAFSDGVDWISGLELLQAIIITVVAFSICIFLPRLTKRIPSALFAIFVCTVLEWLVFRAIWNMKTKTVFDASVGGVGGSFPIPVWFESKYKNNLPPLSGETFLTVLPLAITLASIGLLESLMTLNLIDDMTQTKGDTRKECCAQGAANLLCGILGGMGGCAMIGQSMININSGARNRVSSTCAGVFLILIILVAHYAIDIIPVASLAGVMFNVVYHTFDWGSLQIIIVSSMPLRWRMKLSEELAARKVRRADAFVILLVTIVTLFTDLAIAVVCGTVLSCMIFAWESSENINVVSTNFDSASSTNFQETRGKVYEVYGILFFGSTTKFLQFFDPANDPASVTVIFQNGTLGDYSALEALNTLAERYQKYDKRISVRKLKPGCDKLLRKANSLLKMGYDSDSHDMANLEAGTSDMHPGTYAASKKQEEEDGPTLEVNLSFDQPKRLNVQRL